GVAGIAGFVLTGTIGFVVAVFPNLWLHLFSHDAEVVRDGATYLRIVAPAYGALGFSFVVSFAAQGAGRAMWPLGGAALRIVIAAGGGWLVVSAFGAGMAGLAAMVSASLAAYAAVSIGVLLSPAIWRAKRR